MGRVPPAGSTTGPMLTWTAGGDGRCRRRRRALIEVHFRRRVGAGSVERFLSTRSLQALPRPRRRSAGIRHADTLLQERHLPATGLRESAVPALAKPGAARFVEYGYSRSEAEVVVVGCGRVWRVETGQPIADSVVPPNRVWGGLGFT
ncbi:hypothetical protein GCM10023403_53970 [Pseudonocardia benzenivorans]